MFSFLRKYLILPQRFRSLLAELAVVFIGVFAAFLLSDYQQQQTKTLQQIEIVKAVRADLTAYIDNGTAANSGFIDFFSNINTGMQHQIAKGELTQIPGIIIGDYWYLEALHPMITSGKLNDIQLDLYRDLARFNTLHQNFIQMIADFNRYQLDVIYPHLAQVPQPYFLAPDHRLSPAYLPLQTYSNNLQNFAEISVQHATALIKAIDRHYPQLAEPEQ
ncbi:hypothetical protein EOE67_13820 [Rheinheimera riviphila]|uniref:Uncharacterized protein n=1 Tax=Rheinheimera riviphila TaxID=1834037 RepID=A0A437QLW8_9GAMM|nr:hypothetical protein [Rheinheimera riviphila]RVU35449.1 hypothetical protein EOE67_13820 [Rheinheimera riviphila]